MLVLKETLEAVSSFNLYPGYTCVALSSCVTQGHAEAVFFQAALLGFI